MKKLLLIPLGLLAVPYSYGQDSTAAIYINEYVEKIEANLPAYILEKKDTVIYYEDSSKSVPLRIQTEFYTDPQIMQVAKIIEKSTYKNLTTQIIVYFRFNQPVRLTSIQKEGTVLKTDFDVYYVNNASVHFTKRSEGRGKPDGDELLQWCKDLLKEYDKMVASQRQNEMVPEIKSEKPKKSMFIFKRKKSR